MKIKSLFYIVLMSLGLSACSNVNSYEMTTDAHGSSKVVGSIEIIDKAALEYLSARTTIKEIASGFTWTEGPLWLEASQSVIFSDIPNNKIYQYSESNGLSEYLDKSGSTGLVEGDHFQGSNGLILNQEGKLVLFQQGDRRVAVMNTDLSNPSSSFTTLVGEYNGRRLNSPNDGVFDKQGNLYFTDPPYGLEHGMDDVRKSLPFQGIYKLSPKGQLTLIDNSVKFPNGIGLSPDEKTLYVAVSDHNQPVWLSYDLEHQTYKKQLLLNAAIHNAEKTSGVPDGLAVHSSGVIFATGPGGVWLLDPNGKLLAKILTGKLTANCTLSSDEKQLYITAHDSVMLVELNEL
jgi:gluconolactonase